MRSYDMLFLFAFLPAYMGLFAVVPAPRRSWVIAAGNLVVAASAGRASAAIYLICTACTYFCGIAIYNMRADKQKTKLRKAVFAAATALSVVLLLSFSPRGLNISPLSSLRFVMAAVMPLHMISYITDVYRGDCAAQTSPAQLAAYLGFFPSADYGPVMRYRLVYRRFAEPKPDISDVSKGIRYYIMGLAAYVVIAMRLEELRQELMSTPAEQLEGGVAVMGIFVCYAGFTTAVTGSLMMGHGLAIMQGIRTGAGFRRRFLQSRVDRRLFEFNISFCRWVRDYVSLPLIRYGCTAAVAAAISVTLGALWYGFDTGWLLAGLLLSAAVVIQNTVVSHRKNYRPHSIAGSLAAKLITAAAVSICVLWELSRASGQLPLLRSASVGEDFFQTYFSESILPTAIGLFISGSLLHSLARRMNLRLFKLILPAAELLFLAIATAYIVR